MKRRKRMGMPKVRTMALREGGDATTSPVLPDNENRWIAAEEGELLERGSYPPQGESTPERIVALLNRTAKAEPASTPH